MTYLRYAATPDGTIVQGNYDSNGDWAGEGPDPRKKMVFWIHEQKTPIIEELVTLASERSGVKVEFRPQDHKSNDLDLSNDRFGELWTLQDGKFKGAFTDELSRLKNLVTKPLDEELMREDGRMIGGYVYIVDGVPKECLFFNGEGNTGITPAEYRRRTGATEIRRCDIIGRQQRLPKQERTQFEKNFQTQIGDDSYLFSNLDRMRQRLIGTPHHRSVSGRTIVQAKRRPRSSNKIKKVK